MTTAEDILNAIKKLYDTTKEPLTLTYIHERLKKELKIDSFKIGRQLKILHQRGKIEFISDKIKPKSP